MHFLMMIMMLMNSKVFTESSLRLENLRLKAGPLLACYFNLKAAKSQINSFTSVKQTFFLSCVIQELWFQRLGLSEVLEFSLWVVGGSCFSPLRPYGSFQVLNNAFKSFFFEKCNFPLLMVRLSKSVEFSKVLLKIINLILSFYWYINFDSFFQFCCLKALNKPNS